MFILNIFVSLFLLFCSPSSHGIENPYQVPPIVYDKGYNLGLLGIEKLHPFPAHKYQEVHAYLKKHFNWRDNLFHKPEFPSDEILKKIHTTRYLESLKNSATVIDVLFGYTPALHVYTEKIPNFILRYAALNPMRLATGGTIKALELALDKNNPYRAAINLGGGFHHASTDDGDGFCAYADIPLACKIAWEKNPNLKILYVDLDAHQGDGTQKTLKKEMKSNQFIVFDIYGGNNYPAGNKESVKIRELIHYNYPLTISHHSRAHCVSNETYLNILKTDLPRAIKEIKPDVIIYNAGTDPYEGDALGGMSLTKEGIIERDEFVFTQAQKHGIPIMMTLSGGYSKESASIIGASITNILQKNYGIKPIPKQYSFGDFIK